MSPIEALHALFRENAIPMTDRNGVLHDVISAAMEERDEQTPYAYLVVQEQGYIVGAWKDRETAEKIAAKQLARDAETVVPVVLAEAVKAERAAAVVSDQIRRAVPIEQTGIGKLAP